MRKFLVLLAFVFAPAVNAAEVKTIAKYDEYSKATGIATAAFDVPGIGSFLDPSSMAVHLAGNVTDGGKEGMWLSGAYSGADWKFFGSAQDVDGNVLPLTVDDRRVLGAGRIVENFSITVTRPYLESHRDSGINLRVNGKYGAVIVKLPGDYVAAFMNSLVGIESSVRAKISTASSVLPEVPTIKVDATTPRPKLGIQYVPVTEVVLKAIKLENANGIFIVTIEKGSVAAKAGLMVGDVIQSINGASVAPDTKSLPSLLANIASGDTAIFTIWRAANKMDIAVSF